MEQASIKVFATFHSMVHVAAMNSKDNTVHEGSNPLSEALPPAMPAPPYRHATPSGPWPWMDLSSINLDATATTSVTVKLEVSESTTDGSSSSWQGYPQSIFKNWTPDQIRRSQMLTKCSETGPSTIYWMDVLNDGSFGPSNIGDSRTKTMTTLGEKDFCSLLQEKRLDNIRVQSLCVDDLTKPVLQMLGQRFNIEPFFFTSSINWIPSRYQEALIHEKGDHITITLPFVRTLHSKVPESRSPIHTSTLENSKINTQAPFPLHDGSTLFIDLLAIHMVRDVERSTIISYHPESIRQTSAKYLHKLMLLVGDSVYWQNIFTTTKDPTFLFLTILWYPIYAWDESFELLYNHISTLESDVLKDNTKHMHHLDDYEARPNDNIDPIKLTRQLHVLQAHLLHYQSLLNHFRVSVNFIEETPNPAMESKDFNDDERRTSKELMARECKNLLSEVDRLEKRREMLSSRLKNSTDLAFATVNIEESRQTQTLTHATVRDSAAMRQISYLTMIFLPASFIASVFGMNVKEINSGSLETLAHYIEVTISLTLFTIYIVVTFQPYSSIHKPNATFGRRAVWPILLLRKWVKHRRISTMDLVQIEVEKKGEQNV